MFIRLYRTTIGQKKLEIFFFKVREMKARKSGKFEKNAKKIDFFEVTSGKP